MVVLSKNITLQHNTIVPALMPLQFSKKTGLILVQEYSQQLWD